MVSCMEQLAVGRCQHLTPSSPKTRIRRDEIPIPTYLHGKIFNHLNK